ncbi:MAG: hypothetical protein H6556_10225 [Lewinellaceae bacterium]|nr:hypothetical protein [Lewinellaceae bacterium]
MHLLHHEIIEKASLRIGGISGIIGREDKANRVEEQEYLKSLRQLLNQGLDILLLHETPDYPEQNLSGNPKIREVIANEPSSIVCCGHCHWNKTLIEFDNSSKVMNVDAKVVILKKTPSD